MVAGGAGTRGKFESLLRAEQRAATAVAEPVARAEGSRANPDKAAALAAIGEHNQKVPARQPKDGKKPNVLVTFGDDIGIPRVGAYTKGPMGYQTPNIDRIANEEMLLTDSSGQQSCTAGRSS